MTVLRWVTSCDLQLRFALAETEAPGSTWRSEVEDKYQACSKSPDYAVKRKRANGRKHTIAAKAVAEAAEAHSKAVWQAARNGKMS